MPRSGPRHLAPFVGREAELGLLRDALDAVGDGQPRIVLLHGPPGIGKTALARSFLAGHPEIDSVWSSGDDAESLLAFGVIDQLWRAVGARRPSRGESTVDHLAVGAELLDLFSDLATDRSVAVVVDDVQWADRPSMQALVFAARRLVAERLVLVLVCREDGLDTLPDGMKRVLAAEHVSRIALGGLDAGDLASLNLIRSGAELPTYTAKKLREHTEGNPLYALALLDEVPTEALAAATGDPLPAPRSYAAIVLGRLAGCGAEAVRLAEMASVLGVRCRVVDLTALGASLSPTSSHPVPIREPLDELRSAGLVNLVAGGSDVAFAHPLIHAAVYHDLPPGHRATLHEAAARMAKAEADSIRHRIAATIGEDPALALEVATFATKEADRGAWSSAAHSFLAASRLHDEQWMKEQYVIQGAECLMFGGDGLAAAGFLPQIQAAAPSARRHQLLGFVALVTGDRAGSQHLLEQAWLECTDPADRPVAAKVASQLSMVALNDGRAKDAIDWARQSLAFDAPSTNRGITRAVLGTAHGQLGRYDEGMAASGGTPDDPADYDAESMGIVVGRGVLRMFQGRPAAAIVDLTLADELGRRGVGPFSLRINALFHLADAEYRIGRWDQATMHAELATSLSADTNAVWTLGLAHSVAVFPAAGRGEWDLARSHLESAEQAAAIQGDRATLFWLSVARARVAQARSDHGGVVEAIDTILGLGHPEGRDEPGVQPWKVLYGEALVGLGRLDEATGVAEDLFGFATNRDDHAAMANAYRIHGLVATARRSRDEADAAFRSALELRDSADQSLEDALTHLDYGSMLRRAGSRRAAVDHLGQARDILVRLAATPFLERCQRELAGSGRAPQGSSEDFRVRLTPQEQAVTTLVASGLTNRQVAAQLVISVKTVEYHLGNVFAKLGVTSRSMLTARFHRHSGMGDGLPD